MTFVDFQTIVASAIIRSGIAGGSVYVANEPLHLQHLPAVVICMTSQSGNTNEGFWEAMITVSCLDRSEYAALHLVHDVRAVLDGFGGNGLADVSHISTIPVRSAEPSVYTYAMTFRVLYQEQ